MPRIPRTEQTVGFQPAQQPFSTGDGYAAPGRALQQMGGAISNLGSALGEAADQSSEFDDKLKTLNFINGEDRKLMESQANFTGDPVGHAKAYDEGYQKRAQEFTGSLQSRWGQRQGRLQVESHRGRTYQNQYGFETGRVIDGRIVSTENTITSQFGAPDFEDVDKVMPSAQRALAESKLIIDQLPGVTPAQRDRLYRHAEQQAISRLEATYTAANRRDLLADQAKKVIDDWRAMNPNWQPQGTAAPGQAGSAGRRANVSDAGGGHSFVTASGGARVRVASHYADRFAGLLEDLEAAGVKIDPKQTGGYANRNIAGTNTPSRHSFGEAIDINWTQNARGGMGEIVKQVPPDQIRAIAARNGLKWGGDWRNPDPMHFEVDRSARPQPRSYPNQQTAMRLGGPTGPEQSGIGATAPAANIRPMLTAYSPQRAGDRMEGGYASSRKGPDGKSEVRTLADVEAGRSPYVTLAGDPSQYGKTYIIPEITYRDASGKEVTLKNVRGVVHDTGSAFKGKGDQRFDIPVDRDLPSNGLGAQPFSKKQLNFIPANDRASEITGEKPQAPVPIKDRGLTRYAGLNAPQSDAIKQDVGSAADGVIPGAGNAGEDPKPAPQQGQPQTGIIPPGPSRAAGKIQAIDRAGAAAGSVDQIDAARRAAEGAVPGSGKLFDENGVDLSTLSQADRARVTDAIKRSGVAFDPQGDRIGIARESRPAGVPVVPSPGAQGRVTMGPPSPYAGGVGAPFIEALIKHLPRWEAQKAAEQERWIGGVVRQVEDIKKLAEQGYAPDAAMIGRLETEMRLRPDLASRNGLDVGMVAVQRLLQEQQAMRQATPHQLQQYVLELDAELRERGANPQTLAHKQAAERLLSNMRTAVTDDPLAWADRTGVRKLGKINLDDPASLAQRAEHALIVGQMYGQDPQFFTKVERDALKNIVRMGGEPMLRTVGVLVKSMGPDNARLAMREFATSMPELAYAGALMAGNDGEVTQTARDIAEGLRLKAEGKMHQSVLTDNRLQKLESEKILGTAYKESRVTHDALLATARLIYDVRAPKMGKTDTLNQALYDSIIKELSGTTKDMKGVEYGGIGGHKSGLFSDHRVLVPKNVRADSFDTLLSEVTDADLAEVGNQPPSSVPGQPASLKDAVQGTGWFGKGHTLVSVGANRYKLADGDPTIEGHARYLKNENGSDYVLDLTPLLPRLHARRPDLFKGGWDALVSQPAINTFGGGRREVITQNDMGGPRDKDRSLAPVVP